MGTVNQEGVCPCKENKKHQGNTHTEVTEMPETQHIMEK